MRPSLSFCFVELLREETGWKPVDYRLEQSRTE
jgi:hypothetical protein